ncbi:MAG: carboxypeptidase regulatory-like domain-containing protein [Bacteroidales bacterium]|nr:carboxypeptidase regulatory-like domain-containing protein [Bacteroidales bacterium]
MKTSKILNLIAGMFAVCAMTLGVSACQEDPSEQPETKGTIQGTVVDNLGNPVEGVTVAVSDVEGTVATAADGTFKVEDVDIDRHTLKFTKSGYLEASTSVSAAKFVDGVATVDVTIQIANARISGKVLDAQAENTPLAGVLVSISETRNVTTGEDGSYLFEDLLIQDYTLTFTKQGYPTATKNVTPSDFVDGVAQIADFGMGASEILRGLTINELKNAEKWYYNAYRGGRNGDDYPHFDWSTDFMCTLHGFVGWWEEQNEGTTIQIRNRAEDGDQERPADDQMFDSYLYGSKMITDDNKILTVKARTHAASAEAPCHWAVMVVDLSEADPKAVVVGEKQTLASENYTDINFDLSAYVGKEVVIAIGTFRMETGDYWKQLVLRRLAFGPAATTEWNWLSGKEVTGLEGWKLTEEMVRSTMTIDQKVLTAISEVGGNRDNYRDAYQSWKEAGHIGYWWSFMPVKKDPEPFPSEGFVIKTRHDAPVDMTKPEAYFYAKYAIAAGADKLTLKARNFSSANPTYFGLVAITEDMTVTPLVPKFTPGEGVENNMGEAVGGQLFKFINEDGGQGNPEKYATFEYDLSAFDGKNVVLALGVVKGEESNNEDKLCIYSITLN